MEALHTALLARGFAKRDAIRFRFESGPWTIRVEAGPDLVFLHFTGPHAARPGFTGSKDWFERACKTPKSRELVNAITLAKVDAALQCIRCAAGQGPKE